MYCPRKNSQEKVRRRGQRYDGATIQQPAERFTASKIFYVHFWHRLVTGAFPWRFSQGPGIKRIKDKKTSCFNRGPVCKISSPDVHFSGNAKKRRAGHFKFLVGLKKLEVWSDVRFAWTSKMLPNIDTEARWSVRNYDRKWTEKSKAGASKVSFSFWYEKDT